MKIDLTYYLFVFKEYQIPEYIPILKIKNERSISLLDLFKTSSVISLQFLTTSQILKGYNAGECKVDLSLILLDNEG